MKEFKLKDVNLITGIGLSKKTRYRILEKYVSGTNTSLLIESAQTGLKTTEDEGEKSFIQSSKEDFLLLTTEEEISFI